jgi:RNA polymerase sigma-70 factor (ECF subfamily)
MEGDVSADIQILNQALSYLPQEQREAIVLFEIVGFSIEEIKAMQGGSLSGVKSRLVRARQKLADMLSDAESKKTESVPEKNTIV